jgi:2-oxo-4-hydroxy-4-carboxy-5-ureidoimidazoline decarboxylase
MERLADLNLMQRPSFVARLGHIFEHSPWVAERVWGERPFESVAQLHARMVAVVRRAAREEQLRLIRAHPELLGRLAQATPLSAYSKREQAGAGLTEADDAELAQLASLNAAYREKFGFPFIVAVRGMGRAEIVAHLAARVANAPEREFEECLAQIGRIARFRLDDLVVQA